MCFWEHTNKQRLSPGSGNSENGLDCHSEKRRKAKDDRIGSRARHRLENMLFERHSRKSDSELWCRNLSHTTGNWAIVSCVWPKISFSAPSSWLPVSRAHETQIKGNKNYVPTVDFRMPTSFMIAYRVFLLALFLLGWPKLRLRNRISWLDREIIGFMTRLFNLVSVLDLNFESRWGKLFLQKKGCELVLFLKALVFYWRNLSWRTSCRVFF